MTVVVLPRSGFLEPSPWRRMDARWVREKAVRDLRVLVRAVCLAVLAGGAPGERLLEQIRERSL